MLECSPIEISSVLALVRTTQSFQLQNLTKVKARLKLKVIKILIENLKMMMKRKFLEEAKNQWISQWFKYCPLKKQILE